MTYNVSSGLFDLFIRDDLIHAHILAPAICERVQQQCT